MGFEDTTRIINELSWLRETGERNTAELTNSIDRLTNTLQAIAVWYGHHSSVSEDAVKQLRLELSRVNQVVGVREVSDDVSSLTTTSYPRTGV